MKALMLAMSLVTHGRIRGEFAGFALTLDGEVLTLDGDVLTL